MWLAASESISEGGTIVEAHQYHNLVSDGAGFTGNGKVMKQVNFKKAYYIKLGRGGKWEQSSITESKLRLGWGHQDVQDINRGDWEKIREQLLHESKHKGIATRDFNALWLITESNSEDLWITFFQGTMYWCKLGPKEIFQDDKSKYRQVIDKWSNQDIRGNILEINNLPGVLSKYQAFRGTVCKVRELDTLKRSINAVPSYEYNDIAKCEKALVNSVEKGVRKLHWKDFETFVDLIFRESGWRRTSMVGGTMKFTDLELEDPITGDKYQVQIKSQASWKEFEYYVSQFNPQLHRKLYFVVHSPDKKLSEIQKQLRNIELILPNRLSEMVVHLGLVNWLMSKIR